MPQEVVQIVIALGVVQILLGAVLGHIFTVRRFHQEKQYENKLKRYLELAGKMRGFVKEFSASQSGQKDRQEFADAYRTIWLYGHARVVKRVSMFLYFVLNPPKNPTSKELEIAQDRAAHLLKDAIIAMRMDLKARGKLKNKDFGIFV